MGLGAYPGWPARLRPQDLPGVPEPHPGAGSPGEQDRHTEECAVADRRGRRPGAADGRADDRGGTPAPRAGLGAESAAASAIARRGPGGVARTAGWQVGLLTLLGDVLKGGVPQLVCHGLGLSLETAC